MSPRDTLSALLTATVWGLTFVAIKFGVGEAPPFLLTALRFAFAAVPAVFFIKPPAATPALVVLYGLLIGVGQFGLLFVAFGLGMSVGLASVVMQLQAFFTILLAWAFMGERPTRRQTIATIITFAGVGVIGAARLGGVSFWPFAMTLAAAFCWGAGNFRTRAYLARAVASDSDADHLHHCHLLRGHAARFRALESVADALPRGRRRAIRAVDAGRRNGRRESDFRRDPEPD
jgi:O-acetylserine/cysteine efflux transporter